MIQRSSTPPLCSDTPAADNALRMPGPRPSSSPSGLASIATCHRSSWLAFSSAAILAACTAAAAAALVSDEPACVHVVLL